MMMLETRHLWSDAPPEPRTKWDNWPTVLFSWWCTSFAAVIIITRVLGRKVRSSTLFREDYIMLLAMIPLFIRMVLIHFVLIYGTNNVDTTAFEYTEQELYLRSVGARLVLPARIFYAMFIWVSKLTVSEFLKRITIRIWRRSHEITLQGIRIFLFVTFFAVVIATLAECQPFSHYWQVIPDPGPRCRKGYAQLLVMGTCDIVTDILLIAFPIPVVLTSGVGWKRKVQMISLFSLSAIMIAVTASRMPHVIFAHGRQQYRTIWASCEILASAAVANSVILGSFLRDKGTKRNKFRSHSVSDSIDRTSARRPTLARLQSIDSDEDLFFELGCRVPEHLREEIEMSPRPAPPAPPALPANNAILPPKRPDTPLNDRDRAGSSDSEESLPKPVISQVLPSPVPSTTRSFSLFDVGNLLDEQDRSITSQSRDSMTAPGSRGFGIASHDFASHHNSHHHSMPGSQAFLRDVGGILTDRHESRDSSSLPRRTADGHRNSNRSRPPPTGVVGPMLERHETQMSLQDPGGLLDGSGTGPFASGALETNERRRAVNFNAPRSTPSRSRTRDPSSQSNHVELEDIGGLLRDDRREDASAAAFRRATEHGEHSHIPPPASTNIGSQQGGGFDDMILNDPGGLMKR